jgi:hypothetical protein
VKLRPAEIIFGTNFIFYLDIKGYYIRIEKKVFSKEKRIIRLKVDSKSAK